MSNDELGQRIKALIDAIPDEKIYYALRAAKLLNVSAAQVHVVKIFIVYHRCGIQWLPVPLVQYYLSFPGSAHQRLHLLGDKRVLLLKRGPRVLQYSLDPIFLKHIPSELLKPIESL